MNLNNQKLQGKKVKTLYGRGQPEKAMKKRKGNQENNAEKHEDTKKKNNKNIEHYKAQGNQEKKLHGRGQAKKTVRKKMDIKKASGENSKTQRRKSKKQQQKTRTIPKYKERK